MMFPNRQDKSDELAWANGKVVCETTLLCAEPAVWEVNGRAACDLHTSARFHEPEVPPIPAAGWDELDCGGVYDGFQVTSDADPGL